MPRLIKLMARMCRFNQIKRAADEAQHTTAVQFELLTPDVHLTQPCFRDYKKHVLRHAGWSTQRIQATPEQRKQYKITRQAAVYFTTV